MEALLELIMELVLEGSSYIMEADQRKKYPFWLKLICTLVLFVFALLLVFIACGIFVLGIQFLKNGEWFTGGIMFLLDIGIFIYGISFVRKGLHSYQKHRQDEFDMDEESFE